MNTRNTSNGLRALNAAEVNAVSGAAKELIDLGLFGLLGVGGKCAVWYSAQPDGDGMLSTEIKQCPK